MASRSSSQNHCSAINCSNRQSKRPDLSFFRFSKNMERCQRWVQNTRKDDLLNRSPVYLSNNCRLCAEHFEEDQFSNRMTKNRLKWNAVPTLFNVPNPPKALSTPRKSPSPLVDYSYCKPSKYDRSSNSRNSSNRSDSPASFCSDNTPSRKQEKLLKKEWLRTFRIKKKVNLLKHAMNKAARKSQTVNELIHGASKFLDEPALV
uniref:52 kDa repressor of the inhibitor of the protein kinase-like n=1 Tax=Myxine glutinosa TaxID=7769 RepID=UPI00358FEABB